MMKINRFATLALIFSGLLSATQASELSRWVLASTESSGSPIAIQQKADYVVLPLTLTSLQNNPDKRIEDLSDASEEVKDKMKGSDVRLAEARFDYSAGAAAGLPDMEFDEKEPATLTLYIVVAQKRRGDTFLEQAQVLTDFADKLVLGAVNLNVEKVKLCVTKPEQYRSELLKAIMDEMSSLRTLAGSETILHISGLEGPVEVRQIDKENIEMSINYMLTLEQWGSKDPASFPDR